MKIAFVVQRYGLEVNGGSELHCRLLAERMSAHFEVNIITTCALDYVSWKNHYRPGLDTINNVKVRRFEVKKPRNINKFNRFSEKIFGKKSSIKQQLKWMDLQGPYCPDLINYLSKNKDHYDLIIFYTYLYWPTFKGLSIAPEKSILLPTAHDEPPIHLDIFKDSFTTPKAIIYLTEAEKLFVEQTFKNAFVPNIVLGIGIDNPKILGDADLLKKKYQINGEYVLFAGRVDQSKGCEQLFNFFQIFCKTRNNIQLVLVGKEVMKIPKHPQIKSLGFLEEEEKNTLIRDSELVIIPSQYESLSLIALESWKLKKPILVNAKSDVLKTHCIKSNGGLYYNDFDEFETCLEKLIDEPELRKKLGQGGKKYVTQNYDWPVIKDKLAVFLKKQTPNNI